MGVGPLHIIDEVAEGNEAMEKRERQEGITPGQAKGQTQRWQPLQPNLARVNEVAGHSGQTRFTALLHHVDVGALERAFRRQRRAASPGVDRVTVEDYERNLEANLQRLHERVHSGQYWPKPVRRTYIPKADGSLRPLGIPTLEDKIVQGAVAEVQRRLACERRSILRWRNPPKAPSCIQPIRWRGSGATRASRSKLTNCSLRSTGGLPRGSTRSI